MSDLRVQGVGMTSLRTRERMVQRLIEQGISHSGVLSVMRDTPRHLFLDEALAHRAYEDSALPIGYRQTLSQPFVVARMTEYLLQYAPGLDNVLEIGTGSGYQTAVLSPLVKQLHSVERIEPLQKKARQRLRDLGMRNVQFHLSDGSLGWQAAAPYNAILSAAAPTEVPQSLKEQLAPDGVLVIPAGDETQYLTIITRQGDTDQFKEQRLEAVRFVPLLNGVIR